MENAGFYNIKSEPDSIWVASNWTVASQSIEAGTKIKKSDEIVLTCVKNEDYVGEVGENEAVPPYSASDCKYKNYQDVENAFKNAGFTNISTKILYDIVWGFTSEGEVENVSVDGKSDFTKGTTFSKGAPVVITYHMKEEDDPEKQTEKTSDTTKPSEAVYYSTNNQTTVKDGNAGVYAYKNKGGAYSIYYIIDFYEGYVYWFTEGNGETSCDRLKIDSGNLNSVVIITYHDGKDVWSYGLHFKYKNQPDHLILKDNNHFEYDYYPTNLSDALELRKSKTIYNY